MAVVGGISVAVGIVAATWQVAELDDPLPWLEAGGLLLLIAVAIWRWRLRYVISDWGVSFTPLVLHRRHGFLWSEVTGWHWHQFTVTHAEGGDTKERELVIELSGGTTLVLPYPYCQDQIVRELERSKGGESHHGENKPPAELRSAISEQPGRSCPQINARL
ncbi:MAG: hypothetical protein NT069_32595 [Planctomycetota bacterium]|nr:hypothetical protein [Planctomycetota bacterium]